MIDNLRVASPCSADWTKMTGDGRARTCADCQKTVFNLSGLTHAEAEDLIVSEGGTLCARYFQRHDGTILLKDCSIGVARKRKRAAVAIGAAALLAGVGGWITLARRGSPEAHCANPHLPQAASADVRETSHETLPPAGYDEVLGDWK